ncbi:hypothetical protein L2E82_13331 [Cichorium intybus]|uniref:Uncharacterized protein n=1 Tax=Cichorium intybus TaxID=13427 RepID=A0ACB9EXV7_CICIN|nr:hypothetical protein L2E82_13331 [Cichorium intybus]
MQQRITDLFGSFVVVDRETKRADADVKTGERSTVVNVGDGVLYGGKLLATLAMTGGGGGGSGGGLGFLERREGRELTI